MDTPVLLVGFNRPDRLAGPVESLRAVEPSCLYVAVDGPRADVPGEPELVAQTRAAAELVDWPSDVRMLFREDDHGCGLGVSLTHVEKLLDRYEADDRVSAVSGVTCAPPAAFDSTDSNRFARLTHVWGWAAWRPTWRQHDFDLREWRRRLLARRLWSLAAQAGRLCGRGRSRRWGG